jgi:hypothetical protein
MQVKDPLQCRSVVPGLATGVAGWLGWHSVAMLIAASSLRRLFESRCLSHHRQRDNQRQQDPSNGFQGVPHVIFVVMSQ